jgi:hypothetical protein
VVSLSKRIVGFWPYVIEEQIRQRAYVFYEGRGQTDRSALDDWLPAEKEVLGLREAKAARTSS